MFSDLIVSYIRTFVAIVVGWAASYAARHGWNIDSPTATAQITVACITVYYAIVRLLETKFPKWGWALGYAKAPQYPKPTG